MVGGAKHEIRGTRPYGNLSGTFGLRGGGAKNGQIRGPETLTMGEHRKNEPILQIIPVFW